MLFGRRKKLGNRPTDATLRPGNPTPQAGLYHVTGDIMRKGSVTVRQGKEVRQYGLSFKGVVRLVTSGDVVDRETYDALIAAGVIDPIRGPDPADDAMPASPPASLEEPETEE